MWNLRKNPIPTSCSLVAHVQPPEQFLSEPWKSQVCGVNFLKIRSTKTILKTHLLYQPTYYPEHFPEEKKGWKYIRSKNGRTSLVNRKRPTGTDPWKEVDSSLKNHHLLRVCVFVTLKIHQSHYSHKSHLGQNEHTWSLFQFENIFMNGSFHHAAPCHHVVKRVFRLARLCSACSDTRFFHHNTSREFESFESCKWGSQVTKKFWDITSRI